MNQIFIRFPDNDFCTTVQAFVKGLAPRVLLGEGGWGSITKAQIVALFNETAPALYLLHQNHQLPECGAMWRAHRGTQVSMRITEDHVFMGDEFEKFPSTQWNGDGCLAVLSHDEILFYVV